MMFKQINKYQLQSGLTLPLTILFTFISSGLLFSFILNIYEKKFQVDYKMAQIKALYNAESGIALGAYGKIFKKDYYHNPSEDTASFIPIPGMGMYSIGYYEIIDTIDYVPTRGAKATGYATVKHLLGKKEIQIKRTKKLNLINKSSLSDFLWLTNSEKAGGGPWSFNSGIPSENTRRDNTWGSGDQMNEEWNSDVVCDVGVKTNGQFVMSSFGAPTFNNTVTVTYDDEGNVNSPNLQGQSFNSVFQGNPQLDTLEATCLPPPGYERMKRLISDSNEHITLNSDAYLNYEMTSGKRDTLVMTDLQFFVEGNENGFYVKQWWFLSPPYFKTDMIFPFPSFLLENEWNNDNGTIENDECIRINGENDIRGCPNYRDFLENYHSKTIDSNGDDRFMPNDPYGIVSGIQGFHHFDYPDIYTNNAGWNSQLKFSQLLPEYQSLPGGRKRYTVNHPTAIYIKGGPVRVKGRYKGRYTIVTDEYTPYHRHAWLPSMGNSPIDTLWNNIWITDDLLNDDTNSQFSLAFSQPTPDCEGGSNNALGLVSGANIIISNTHKNGAFNGGVCSGWNNPENDCNINIHAHMIAFNESFLSHYWQNTYNQPYSNPPYGDGQGHQIYGNSGLLDSNGEITIWGGVVQDHRGYVVRNNPGPYNTGDIGFPQKNYNFDCNLKCNFPPLYPENVTCDDAEDEIPWEVSGYY